MALWINLKYFQKKTWKIVNGIYDNVLRETLGEYLKEWFEISLHKYIVHLIQWICVDIIDSSAEMIFGRYLAKFKKMVLLIPCKTCWGIMTVDRSLVEASLILWIQLLGKYKWISHLPPLATLMNDQLGYDTVCHGFAEQSMNTIHLIDRGWFRHRSPAQHGSASVEAVDSKGPWKFAEVATGRSCSKTAMHANFCAQVTVSHSELFCGEGNITRGLTTNTEGK